MRKVYILFITALLIGIMACSKKSKEETLNIKLITDNPAKSTNNTHTFSMQVLSQMPTGGVKVVLNVKREDTNASVYNLEYTTNNASSNMAITNLPSGQVYCTANLIVTSLSDGANTWSGSFRVLWK